MAHAGFKIGIEECEICCELLKNPRVLDCDHVFCLNCLEKLERNKKIPCPKCREDTKIPVGLQVKHLPKRSQSLSGPTKRKDLSVIKSWMIDYPTSAVVIDDEEKLIYVGVNNKGKATQIYTFTGRHTSTITGNCFLPGLALDTKRKLLVCGIGKSLRSFNKTGTQVGKVTWRRQIDHLDDIAYLADKDQYILADGEARTIHFYNPATEKIIKSVPAEEARKLPGGGKNVSIATPKTSYYSLIATADSDKSLVKLYDGEGNFIISYGGVGSGFGKMNKIDGICFDYEGRILVSDRENQRIIRISPDAVDEHKEWEVIKNTEKFGVGHPRALDVTSDGVIVLASFTSLSKGPSHITILGGYQ